MSLAEAVPTLNISFYRFVSLGALADLRQELRTLCNRLGLKGTILLSEEGINGFLAGPERSVREFVSELSERPEFAGITPKESWSREQPFRRMLVKLKKEIISMGMPEVRPAEMTAKRMDPVELKRWLDEGKPVTLLDTRNDYEMRVGAFAGAVDLGLTHFRQFPEKLRQIDPGLKEQPVVMYCTGGIRCEKAGAVALSLGFKEVYQLEGGILKYFEECGGAHYQGECFVFDQRVAVTPTLEPSPDTVQCFVCRMPLTLEERRSPHYEFEKSCPYCRGEKTARSAGASESA